MSRIARKHHLDMADYATKQNQCELQLRDVDVGYNIYRFKFTFPLLEQEMF